MDDDDRDDGLTINGLWGTAWFLGLAAMGCLIRLVHFTGGEDPGQTELFVWVLIAMMATVFSACCAVLAGIKSVERRLSRRISQART